MDKTMTLWKTPDGVSLDTLAEEATVSDLVEALQAEEAGGETWFCNSVLAPRCTKESHDQVVETFGGHTSCQRVFVVPLGEDAE